MTEGFILEILRSSILQSTTTTAQHSTFTGSLLPAILHIANSRDLLQLLKFQNVSQADLTVHAHGMP